MALDNTSSYAEDWSKNNSYIPETTLYNQGDYAALAESMNSSYALYNRLQYNKKQNDLSQFEGLEFNRDNMVANLRERKLPDTTIEKMLERPLDNWNEAENALAHIQHLEQVDRQVQENFTTAGMLSAGALFALADPIDIITGLPIIKAASITRKTLNLSTKLGMVAHTATTGAALSAASAATYEASSETYRDDSLIQAAVFGAALGGGLGFLIEKAPLNPSLTKYLDEEGKPLTKEDVIAEEIVAKQDEAASITKLIDEVTVLTDEQKAIEVDLRASQVRDRGRARSDAKIIRSNIEQLFDSATTFKNEAGKAFTDAFDNLARLTKGKQEVETALLKAEDNVATLNVKTKEVQTSTAKLTKLDNTIAPLQKQLDNLAGVSDPKARKAINDKLQPLVKEAKQLRNAITKLNKEVAAIPQDSAARIKELEASQKSAADEVFKAEQRSKEVALSKEEAEAKYIKAKTDAKNFKVKEQAKELERDSLETKSLTARLAEYKADLSPEGLQRLAEELNVVNSDLSKLQDGDINISSFKKIRVEQQNYIKKLNDELEEFDNVKDFKLSPTFKRLPKWVQKIMSISVIQQLVNSGDDLVTGLAVKLSNPTMSHGKTNTHTALNVREQLHNILSRTRLNTTFRYKLAVKDGYRGSRDDFVTDVGREVHIVNGRLQREMMTGIDQTLPDNVRIELAIEKSKTLTRDYSSANPHVRKAADGILDYYKTIQKKGKALDIDAFKNTYENGYSKRVYSAKKINQLGEETAIERITEAQILFAEGNNLIVTDAIRKEFRDLATTAVKSALERRNLHKMVTKPLGKPVQATSSSLKHRTINAYDDNLADVLDDNVEAVASIYGLQTHGRMALKETIGLMEDAEFEALITSTPFSKATVKDKDNLRVLYQTIVGTRDLANSNGLQVDIIKAVSSVSSIMHTMGFGLPTITESAAIAANFGWGKTIEKLIGSTQDVYRAYRFGTPSEKNTMETFTVMAESIGSSRANRLDDLGGLEDAGNYFQEYLSDIIHKESIFSGLLPITDVLRAATASLTVDFLAQMSVAKKISKADRMRLQDAGWDIEDLARIRKILKVTDDGRINNQNRASWGEKFNNEIELSTITMVNRIILNPNGASLPKFMSDMSGGGIVPRIFLKFMRFPMASYENLLGRGIQEADAKQLMGLAGNIAMWTGILSMKDAMREKDKQQYTGSDGLQKLALDSLINNSLTSYPFAVLDKASGVVTGKNFTNDYRSKFGGVVQSDYEKAINGNVSINLFGKNVNIGEIAGNTFNMFDQLDYLNEE